MKTIMDAVNEFKGVWPNYSCETAWALDDSVPLFMGGSVTERTVCTSYEFDVLVAELQNWQPTTGGFKNE